MIKGKRKIRIKLPEVVDETEYCRALYNSISRIVAKCSCNTIWLSVMGENKSIDYYVEKINAIYQERNADFTFPSIVVDESETEYDLNLVVCEHVKNVKQCVLPDIYFDKYLNCITSEEDYKFFRAMDINKAIFKWIYTPIMTEAIYKIREKNN